MKYADEKENITTTEETTDTEPLTLPYTELLRYTTILKDAENSNEYSKERSKVKILQTMLDSFVVLEKLYLSGEYTQEHAIDEILVKLTLEALITARIFGIDATTSVEHNMQKIIEINEHNELTEQLMNITPETLNQVLPSLPDEQIELISRQIQQYNTNKQARKFIEYFKEKQEITPPYEFYSGDTNNAHTTHR